MCDQDDLPAAGAPGWAMAQERAIGRIEGTVGGIKESVETLTRVVADLAAAAQQTAATSEKATQTLGTLEGRLASLEKDRRAFVTWILAAVGTTALSTWNSIRQFLASKQ